jgi:hypothetical protein
MALLFSLPGEKIFMLASNVCYQGKENFNELNFFLFFLQLAYGTKIL